ncbi:hypothetical protein AGMMS49982_20790 [Bacteroidia bacterium]|nr:hypothetical protein AGMMS49982_20790 [Bacteroidia bacterium]
MKSNPYLQGSKNGFGISPYMQEMMVYAGHLDTYERCNEVIEKFLSVEVSPSQVYRVTNAVAEFFLTSS